MDLVKNRFLEHNCDSRILDRALKEIDDESGGGSKKCKSTQEGISIPFVTEYSREALVLKKLIQKNCHIIKADPVIGEKVSSKPQIIFRRAPNIRDLVTSS